MEPPDPAITYAQLCKQKPTLLLVDDDDLYNQIVAANLKGFNVEVAPTCFAALKYLDEHQVDGVILDMRLPDCDGIGLIANIRKVTKAPCLVVTGYECEGESYRRAMQAGASGFMLKPDNFKDGSFVSRIESMFHPK